MGWLITAGVFAWGMYLGHLADLGVITAEESQYLVAPGALVGLILLALTGNLVKKDKED